MGYTLLWHTAFLRLASIEFIALSNRHFGRVFAYSSCWVGPPKGSTRRLQFKLANEGTRPRSNTSETRYRTLSGTPKWCPTDSNDLLAQLVTRAAHSSGRVAAGQGPRVGTAGNQAR